MSSVTYPGRRAETVALDEGHHVVFQREQIVRAHGQAIILADGGGAGGQMWKVREPGSGGDL